MVVRRRALLQSVRFAKSCLKFERQDFGKMTRVDSAGSYTYHFVNLVSLDVFAPPYENDV